jgi:hypothetical protein
LFPDKCTDGQGHSLSQSIMYPNLNWQRCAGFTADELERICNHRACGEVTIECE